MLSDAIICKFSLLCDKRWAELSKIDGQDGTRFCDSCQQSVHFVDNYEEFVRHAGLGHCVAVVARGPASVEQLFVGQVVV